MATRLIIKRLCNTNVGGPTFLSLSNPSLKTLAIGSVSINHKLTAPRNQESCRLLHTSTCFLAGHSKWQNIKHIKAARDQKLGQMSNLLVQRIQNALLRNPETNPKLNTELANLIKWARTNNIPNDVVNKAIDRQVKLRDPKSITIFDARGPSNTGMVVECFSLNPNHTKGLLQGLVKKYGFNLNNSAADLFEQKGIVDVALSEEDAANAAKDPDNFSLDKFVDIAIEAGAEDVTLQHDGEKFYLQFVSSPQDVSKVHKALEDAGMSVTNGERTFLPTSVVPVSQEFLDTMGKLIDKLDLQQDVIKYYFNVELENS